MRVRVPPPALDASPRTATTRDVASVRGSGPTSRPRECLLVRWPERRVRQEGLVGERPQEGDEVGPTLRVHHHTAAANPSQFGDGLGQLIFPHHQVDGEVDPQPEHWIGSRFRGPVDTGGIEGGDICAPALETRFCIPTKEYQRHSFIFLKGDETDWMAIFLSTVMGWWIVAIVGNNLFMAQMP